MDLDAVAEQIADDVRDLALTAAAGEQLHCLDLSRYEPTEDDSRELADAVRFLLGTKRYQVDLLDSMRLAVVVRVTQS